VLYAQNIKEFQKDSTLFIEQFNEFTGRNISEREKDSLDSFVEKWNTNYFSEDVKNRFIDICNLMLSNKASRDPYFTKYFDIVMAFHQSEKSLKHYDSWEKGLTYIFETEKYPLKIITGYFKHSKSLIQDSIIFSSYSTSWGTSSDDFEFIVDNTLKIKFNKTNLTCKIKNDSINIFETEGYYYPISNEWQGKDGYITWERAGYSADSVNAVFAKYKINLKKSGYVVDSAIFTNKLYFSEPILGKISDQVTHVMSSNRAVLRAERTAATLAGPVSPSGESNRCRNSSSNEQQRQLSRDQSDVSRPPGMGRARRGFPCDGQRLRPPQLVLRVLPRHRGGIWLEQGEHG
ncbi:MAG: hypothetical protein KAQ75_07255, partial [Bacteroidales bacterium]|nr:hypothetical protein [Bacteroidales bacterium]